MTVSNARAGGTVSMARLNGCACTGARTSSHPSMRDAARTAMPITRTCSTRSVASLANRNGKRRIQSTVPGAR